MRHPCLPSVPSLLSALFNVEKLHQWLSVFVLAVDRFLFLTVIVPLNSFLSGASFLRRFLGFSASIATVAPPFRQHHQPAEPESPRQTHCFRCTNVRVPSALANQSLLVDVKHITTGAPAGNVTTDTGFKNSGIQRNTERFTWR